MLKLTSDGSEFTGWAKRKNRTQQSRAEQSSEQQNKNEPANKKGETNSDTKKLKGKQAKIILTKCRTRRAGAGAWALGFGLGVRNAEPARALFRELTGEAFIVFSAGFGSICPIRSWLASLIVKR